MNAKLLGVAALIAVVVAHKPTEATKLPDSDIAVLRQYINNPETDDPEFYQSVVDVGTNHAD